MVRLGDRHIAKCGRHFFLSHLTDLVEPLLDVDEQTPVVVLDTELVGAERLRLGDIQRRCLGHGLDLLVRVLLGRRLLLLQ